MKIPNGAAVPPERASDDPAGHQLSPPRRSSPATAAPVVDQEDNRLLFSPGPPNNHPTSISSSSEIMVDHCSLYSGVSSTRASSTVSEACGGENKGAVGCRALDEEVFGVAAHRRTLFGGDFLLQERRGGRGLSGRGAPVTRGTTEQKACCGFLKRWCCFLGRGEQEEDPPLLIYGGGRSSASRGGTGQQLLHHPMEWQAEQLSKETSFAVDGPPPSPIPSHGRGRWWTCKCRGHNLHNGRQLNWTRMIVRVPGRERPCCVDNIFLRCSVCIEFLAKVSDVEDHVAQRNLSDFWSREGTGVLDGGCSPAVIASSIQHAA